MKNLFCENSDLRNESDVEQFFVIRLLNSLGYKDKNIHTKKTITVRKIGKGKSRKNFLPDYIIYIGKYPIIVIDVKHPEINPDEGLKDALLYAREINGEFVGRNPIKFCIGTNGQLTKVCKWDENLPSLTLKFSDFQFENKRWSEFKNVFLYEKLKKIESKVKTEKGQAKFIKPDIGKIKGIFRACHNMIWNSEKSNPSFAFYEFVKLMFIKLNEDKKLHNDKNLREKIEAGLPIPEEKVVFSVKWIEKQEEYDLNPVNSILFKNLRESLEQEIKKRKKKRIFDKDEQIKLKPSTIKNVVEMLENLDLFGIDEDLNGRLFETFLGATMRGKELGQYFTPRTVVDFMTKMVEIRADKKHIDKVFDGCCGTGGFLIEAMAEMSKKINENDSLSDLEKEDMLFKIRTECIYGIDVGKEPPIARIARINMYLHKDGGSRIYQCDTLDKELQIEKGMDEELESDIIELKKKLLDEKLKFNVVLTNPPFAMKYSMAKKTRKVKDKKKEKEQEKILKQYSISKKHPYSEEFRPSLKSSVMFLERYHELIVPHGKLLTIMDESVLNTATNKPFRKFIRDKFIIQAVIALPNNTFVKAESGVKTSILCLMKKKNPKEEQPKVFMAISENVGHNDAGKPTSDDCDLDKILERFKKFELEGKL